MRPEFSGSTAWGSPSTRGRPERPLEDLGGGIVRRDAPGEAQYEDPVDHRTDEQVEHQVGVDGLVDGALGLGGRVDDHDIAMRRRPVLVLTQEAGIAALANSRGELPVEDAHPAVELVRVADVTVAGAQRPGQSRLAGL